MFLQISYAYKCKLYACKHDFHLSLSLHPFRYKEGMKRVSTLFHDRPMKPVDTALWWTEYVLRHDNVHHLRSMSINKSWYERRHLDVWGTIALVVITSITFAFYIVKLAVGLLRGSGSGNEKFKKQ